MDIARQPLPVACLTLAAVAVAAIWCGSGGSAPSPVRPDALPGDWVSAFQFRYPGWSRWIALFCILFTGIYLGRFSNRFNLYAGRCYLPIPFFGMAACCFGAGGDSLLHFVVAAIAAIAPGVLAKTVEDAHRAVFLREGLDDYALRGLGHGIGLQIHECPRIVIGNETVLKPGMIFTVEPGLYFPNDCGVRTEDDVLVTENGVENLSHTPHKIQIG